LANTAIIRSAPTERTVRVFKIPKLLYGREHQLHELALSYARIQGATTEIVLIQSQATGGGSSALCRHFANAHSMCEHYQCLSVDRILD
jgi:hypothetical protein